MNSMASIMALYQKFDDENYVLYKNRDLQFIKLVSEALEKKYPESQHVKALVADKTNLLKRYEQAKTKAKLKELTQTKPVNKMPEIALPNQDGDTISLNALQAKYILLSFWASWSQESVNKNLELIDLYKKYHSKGFEIYQVSLDTKKENWIKSINFDQLPWINVIDINGRSSYYARIYNVQKIPTNYLINPEGEIVMVNPSKKELNETFAYALK
jgi:peroxiredoxin